MSDTEGGGGFEGTAATESLCPKDERKQIGVSLWPLDFEDRETIRAWRNDFEIWRWCRQYDLISDLSQKKWFEEQEKDPKIKMYMIAAMLPDIDGAKYAHHKVGVCGFTDIDKHNRRAEFSIYISSAYQRMGLAKGAMYCLLRHGFLNHGFHTIWGEAFDGNPANELYEKLGFRLEGTRKDFYFREGKFIDAFIYAMSDSDLPQLEKHIKEA